MARENFAILISFLSLAIAAVALGWNIYRDVYLRARLKVSFGLRTIHSPSFSKPIWRFVLSVTNLGPGKVKIQMVQLRDYSFWKRIRRKCRQAVLIHDYSHPLGGHLPYELEVGAGMDLTFPVEPPPDENSFLKDGFTHIGISDSFGRVHWSTRKDMEEARKAFESKKWERS